jgi:hypothetical protein
LGRAGLKQSIQQVVAAYKTVFRKQQATTVDKTHWANAAKSFFVKDEPILPVEDSMQTVAEDDAPMEEGPQPTDADTQDAKTEADEPPKKEPKRTHKKIPKKKAKKLQPLYKAALCHP